MQFHAVTDLSESISSRSLRAHSLVGYAIYLIIIIIMIHRLRLLQRYIADLEGLTETAFTTSRRAAVAEWDAVVVIHIRYTHDVFTWPLCDDDNNNVI